jgi:nitrite reductase/ring-hydroxylating ferredoxin subunit
LRTIYTFDSPIKSEFMNWVKIFTSKAEAIARLAQNVPRLIIISGKRICIVRREDVFYAVQDACPHNGESLSKGSVNYLGEVICPWHNYRFDLKTGRECAMRSKDLITYPVKIDDSGFYLGM